MGTSNILQNIFFYVKQKKEQLESELMTQFSFLGWTIPFSWENKKYCSKHEKKIQPDLFNFFFSSCNLQGQDGWKSLAQLKEKDFEEEAGKRTDLRHSWLDFPSRDHKGPAKHPWSHQESLLQKWKTKECTDITTERPALREITHEQPVYGENDWTGTAHGGV